MLKIGKKFLPGFVSLVLKAYLSDENHKSVVLLRGKMPLFFFFPGAYYEDFELEEEKK